MYRAFLLKYSEIWIKGKNRYLFENALLEQVKRALDRCEGRFEVIKEQGRVFVAALTEFDYDETLAALKRVFGVSSICPVVVVEDSEFENLKKNVYEYVSKLYGKGEYTFKVEAKRGYKDYPLASMEIASEMGAFILDSFPGLKVDVHEPQIRIHIEIRKNAYIYSQVIKGAGGMPMGTSGSATLLLSGGIDSPVAGYMIARRGVHIDAVYFHAPPYTSERAKEKVIDLARQVSLYSGPMKLYVVNFTEIQMYIYDTCPHDELTIHMRRYMMRIAETIAKNDKSLGLITGESIGQVASQTLQSLNTTNSVCTLPVYRPLIGFDKQDIIEIAKNIGTFDTSILPYEDCCTIYVAKHPVTKPRLDKIERSEKLLYDKIDEMVERALNETEVIEIE